MSETFFDRGLLKLIPRPGKGSSPHFLAVLLHGRGRVPSQFGVSFHKFGPYAIIQAEEIVPDEDLTIAARAGTDADGRNRDSIGDLFAK